MNNLIVYCITQNFVGCQREPVYKLFDSVLGFLENKDDILWGNLIKWKSNIAYLTDVFKKCNETNLQLQGDDLNLIKTKSIITTFMAKHIIFKINLGLKEYS